MLNLVRRVVQNPAEGLVSSHTVTIAASTAMMIYNPIKPCRVVRWGCLVTGAISDDASGTLKFRLDTYPEPNAAGTAIATGATTSVSSQSGYNASNSPAFYYDAGGGTISVTNATLNPTGFAVGQVLWHNVNPQAAGASGYYPDPDTNLTPPGGVDTQLVLYPGGSARIYCVNAPSTPGSGIFWMEIEDQAWVADYNNNAAVVSGYPSTNGTTPTPSWPFQVGASNYQS